jgi:hypothetical protein
MKRILVLSLGILFLSGYISRVLSQELKEDQWEAMRNADKAFVSSEWDTPVWIEEVNTPGWEDGPYIAGDGNTLYFAYINIDLFKLPKVLSIGPNRDESKVCNPPCGQFPRPDLFYSTKDSQGRWQPPRPHPLTIPYPVGGIVMVGENKAYFMQEKQDGLQTEICYAENINGEWQPPVRIPALSSKYKDDDPYVTSADNEMFFWSNRPAELGGNNIYYTKKVNGEWQSPVILPAPINSHSNDLQPFLFGNVLYFTSDREGKPKIYRSVLTNDSRSLPEVVVSSKHGVGEPTLTVDGKYLCFVQFLISNKGEANPEIMYTERK